jgi:hypothetical protein
MGLVAYPAGKVDPGQAGIYGKFLPFIVNIPG